MSRPATTRSSRRRGARRRLLLVLVGLALLGVTSGVLVLRSELTASADAPGPPDYSVLKGCPGQQYPPSGYPPNGAFVGHNDPATVRANLGKGDLGYMVPFKGTIGSQHGVDGWNGPSNAGGELVVPSVDPTKPALIVPHIYGVVCGLVALPEETGVIFGSNIKLAMQPNGQSATNAYIGSNPQGSLAYPNAIEALPLVAQFSDQTAQVNHTAAHNGGLDANLNGSQSASIALDGTPGAPPNALGTNCPLNVQLSFSTQASAQVNGVTISGQPVTGPVMGGQAVVVSNPFAVPALQPGPTCPAVVAQAVNRLLGLPLPPGRAVFVAPFTFNFEINQP